MADDARLAYLQARLQARHGDRPSADDWRVAEASADLSHYLEALRRTSLKRWIGDLNHEMEPEAIERQLRAAWRELLEQVAHWAPEEWRPAIRWMRWLPNLPAVDHLLRGLKVPPWMRADPVMRDFAFDDPGRRREAFAEFQLAGLEADGEPGPPRVAEAWIAEWRRRMPKGARDREELDEILEQLLAHVEAMRASEDTDGRALRNLLGARLARRFRRGAGTAVALFTHLLLDGLELERVRAGIMTRRLLPERVEGRSWA
jgi:hypothetical protein